MRKFFISYAPETDCWVWEYTRDRKGYGKVARSGRTHFVHRYVYEQVKGPIPDGLELDHLCRNRICCNPDHLEPVTHAENLRRALPYREAKTQCRQGHEYTPENTYIRPNGRRDCRECKRIRNRTWRRRAA